MDAEIQEALSRWTLTQLKERFGPTKHKTLEGRWKGPASYYQRIFDDVEPGLGNIIITQSYKMENDLFKTWPLLPDRVIGVLMQAGAAKFLPPVEVE